MLPHPHSQELKSSMGCLLSPHTLAQVPLTRDTRPSKRNAPNPHPGDGWAAGLQSNGLMALLVCVQSSATSPTKSPSCLLTH